MDLFLGKIILLCGVFSRTSVRLFGRIVPPAFWLDLSATSACGRDSPQSRKKKESRNHLIQKFELLSISHIITSSVPYYVVHTIRWTCRFLFDGRRAPLLSVPKLRVRSKEYRVVISYLAYHTIQWW
jgi:hypothetical protein